MRQPVKQLAVVLTPLKLEQPSQLQIRLQALARFQVKNNFATAGGRNLQMMNYAEIFKIVHDGCILHFVNNAARSEERRVGRECRFWLVTYLCSNWRVTHQSIGGWVRG